MTSLTREWRVVHDFAFTYAGAERVTSALADDVFPGAGVSVLGGDSRILDLLSSRGAERLLPRHLVTSRNFRALVPAYPAALAAMAPIESNIICSSYAFSHHVRSAGRKIVYCHTPLRQIWSGAADYQMAASRPRRLAMRTVSGYLRRADVRAAATADVYVASSEAVRRRVVRFYGRTDVEVVAPPVDLSIFHPTTVAEPLEREYFLWVGRITEPYKRLSAVLDAFATLPHELIVVGDGPDRERLEQRATQNVKFVGWKSGQELSALYGSARALIFPSEDDFGLVPVEAIATGTPVLAVRAGGAAETVVEGRSGLFFEHADGAEIARVVRESFDVPWRRDELSSLGREYGSTRFVEQMQSIARAIS